MTKTKLTKKDYFAILKSAYPTDAADYDAVIAFIDHEVELLSRKSASDKKPTAQQVANEAIKQAIVAAMKPNTLYTITDIQKSVAECADLTHQRVSALVRLLKEDGVVTRTEDKRKAYFSLA